MTSSVCASNCVKDVKIPVVRATYVNLYKWPESDAEFIRSAAAGGGGRRPTAAVESFSCRQLYLRSYTFSREEKSTDCCGRARRKKNFSRRSSAGDGGSGGGGRRKKNFVRLRRGVVTIFRRLLSCTTKVDVVG